jgi:hypothetical protein
VDPPGADPYVPITGAGAHSASTTATGLWYNPGAVATPVTPTAIRSIQFQVSAAAAAYDYNFCISNVTIQ